MLPVCVSTATLVASAAIAGVTSIGLFLSGRHGRAVERTETSLEIAGEHIAAAGAGPPNDEEDPNWLKDKLDDAQKHVNNARKSVEKAVGRTKRELQRKIDEAQAQIDQLRPSN